MAKGVKEPKFRHELKYLCSAAELKMLEVRLQDVMRPEIGTEVENAVVERPAEVQEEKPEPEYIWKPEQVGDDEYRSERNHIIDTCMDHCIVEPVPVFDQGKGNQVGNHVKEHGPGQPDLVGK